MLDSDKHDRSVHRADTWARWIITFGSAITILSVIAIMAFVFKEVAPLLRNPEIRKTVEWSASRRLSPVVAMAIGTDEYLDTAFRLDARGNIDFLSLETGAPLQTVAHPAISGKTVISACRMTKRGWMAFGTEDGFVGSVEVKYRADYSGTKRAVKPSVDYGPLVRLFPSGVAVSFLAGAADEEGKVTVAGYSKSAGLSVAILDAPGGVPKITQIDTKGAVISALAMKSSMSEIVAGTPDGHLLVFGNGGGEFSQVEKFKASDTEITALAFLIADEALIVGDASGNITEWFPVRYLKAKNNGATPVKLWEGVTIRPGEEREVVDKNYAGKAGMDASMAFSSAGMRYMKVRSFKNQGQAIRLVVPSPRGKGFVNASVNGSLAYHYSTSGKTYAQINVVQRPSIVAFAPKSNGILVLGEEGMLYGYSLKENHPEVSFKTLFSKVWYEGYTGPEMVWQSSGGTDEFEPKLSLWPLIFGTLKGTFYAMFFSVPIALLGAIYLSQLAPAGLRNVVKPLIEMMAAIPSVVVGFLAGLWLAPMLNAHLSTFFMMFISVPAAWFFLVCAWWALPRRLRPVSGTKGDLLFLLPIVLVALLVGWAVSEGVEHLFFHGDMKQWLYSSLGLLYDPRNCVVVGFALGFAVIPIIFTISEDALSAVPPSLTAASYALAASRWQTAIHVVLPAASPGIFAAVMLGLGRAVGETMIVLMATGNTPIMDVSIFNGMRAMSAAIAVEMPEAPVGGSLYRILFLVGFLLFSFTFVINTLAELVSARLRKKYSRF